MKKVIAIVMALCLMLGMGVTAFALSEEYYDISLCCTYENPYGIEVTRSNKDDVLGDGTVRYDEKTNTLYLKNAKLEAEAAAIWYYGEKDTFTINLEGNNVIGSKEERSDVGIDVTGSSYNSGTRNDLVIKGSGNLTIYDRSAGISVLRGDITIDMTGNLTIDEESRGAECCIYADNGDINIKGGNLDLKAINGHCFDVFGDKRVNITGGRLKLNSNWQLFSSENSVNTNLPVEISEDGDNYTEGTPEQLCTANYGRINWLSNEPQKKPVKNETDTIVIDLNGEEEPEEVEENPNTGAPVLFLAGIAALAGAAEVYMLKRKK